MRNANVTIRPASQNDLPAVVDLCEAHAAFEKLAFNRSGQAFRLGNDLFANPPKLYCLVAQSGDALVAYATYMKQYATWEAAEYCYMDCLFVAEHARGEGIGERLMNRLKSHAEALGCQLIQWQTPVFNTRAMKFYRRIGAKAKTKERFFLPLAP